MTESDDRSLQVPDGLGGERVDVGLARMFGISRSRAAELLAQDLVQLDGRPAAKSDRLLPGAQLDVTFPRQADPL
jgi:23S rRNA pseudouridine1911/1915/1917 synthase